MEMFCVYLQGGWCSTEQSIQNIVATKFKNVDILFSFTREMAKYRKGYSEYCSMVLKL
jgi:hypothetical protein